MSKTTNIQDDPRLKVKVKQNESLSPGIEYRVASDGMINLSRKRAFDFLELKTFEGEREVNESWVQTLMNAQTAGRFMWEHVMICICRFDGESYRINGQHTCWMRVNLDDTVRATVREVVYSVNSMEQLRNLYATFDQNKTRSAGHIFKSLLVGTSAIDGVWKTSMNLVRSGLRLWLYPEQNQARAVCAQDLAALVQGKWGPLTKQVAEFIQNNRDQQIIRRASVVAAIYATYNTLPSKAFEFWDPVASGLNLTDREDPRWQLRRFLETHGHSTASLRDSVVVSQETMYRICIQAWNKWRKDERVLNLRPTEKRIAVI